jgi:hypothetical protein
MRCRLLRRHAVDVRFKFGIGFQLQEFLEVGRIVLLFPIDHFIRDQCRRVLFPIVGAGDAQQTAKVSRSINCPAF